MNQFYPFIVPGGLALFAAIVGIAAWIAQHRRHVNAARAQETGDGSIKAHS